MPGFLESFVNNNPLLEPIKSRTGGIYSIYNDLWNDVKKNLEHLIKSDIELQDILNDKKIPLEVNEFWFEISDSFNINKFKHLTFLLEHLAKSKAHPGNYIVAKTTFLEFLARARTFNNGIIKVPYHSSEHVLNAISLLAGSPSFRDYARKKYLSDSIRVVILPFGNSDKLEQRIELRIKKTLKMRFGNENWPIQVKFIKDFEFSTKSEFLDFEEAKRIGNAHEAQLVIFGELFLDENPQKTELSYIITDPLLAMEKPRRNLAIDPFIESELYMGHIPNNLEAIIYHSMAMGEFFQGKYDHAIIYLRKILDLQGTPHEEIFFRIGVLYDILDEHTLALEFYRKFIKESMLQNNLEESSRADLSGDYINREILSKYPEEIKALKIVFFELVRKKISSIFLKNNNQAIVKLQMERALVNLAKISQQNHHLDLLGEVYLELAIIHLNEPFKSDPKSLHDGLTYLYRAIECISDHKMHEIAIPYFLNYEQLKKAREIVEKSHTGNEQIINLYKLSNQE